MKKVPLVLYVAILSQQPLSAQQPWTLEQCCDYAVAHNIGIRQREHQREQQELQVSNARYRRLPDLNGSVGENFSFGRGLTADNTYTNTNTSSTSFSLGTSVPLFTGFEIPNQIRLTRLNLEAATQDLEKAKNDIRMQVAQGYVQVLYDQELLAVARRQVSIDSAQVARLEAMLAVGRASEAEVSQQRATLAQSQLTVTQAGNNLQLELLSFSQLLELDSPAGFTIVAPSFGVGGGSAVAPSSAPSFGVGGGSAVAPSSAPSFSVGGGSAVASSSAPSFSVGGGSAVASSSAPSFSVGGGSAVASSLDGGWEGALEALSFRPEIQAEQLRLQAADRSIDIARAGLYPTLSFSAGLGTNYYTTSGYSAEPFGTQLKNNFSQYLGLSLNIPIFNRFQTQNSIRSARLDRQNQQLALDNAKKTLYKEIQQAWYNTVAASEKLRSSDAARQASESAFRLMQAKYEQGRATITEFNEAKNNLMKTESDLTQARYEYLYQTALLKFYRGEPLRF